MQYMLLAVILCGGISASPPNEPKRATRDSLIGTWVKVDASNDDAFYVESLKWDISVTFQSDGGFVWHAICRKRFIDKEGTDLSVKGTYSVMGGVITYRFDNPSPEALKGLPLFVACFPKKSGGYHSTYFVDNDTLCLGAEKIGTILKRKSDTPKSSVSDAGIDAKDASMAVAIRLKPATSLIGSWVMTQAHKEGEKYPADGYWYWHVTINFQSNGYFVWHANKNDMAFGNQAVDVSATGTYSIKDSEITYQFDQPSADTLTQLAKFFVFQPNQLRGQHTYLFPPDNALLLANEDEKRWFYFKRQAEPVPTTTEKQ